MNGKISRDLLYCEVFNDHESADPMDIALHAGDIIEIIRDFTAFDEPDYLALVPDGDSWNYATIPMDAVNLEVENGNL